MSDTRAYYARTYSREAITQRHMESFATTCRAWASKIDNASDRQSVVAAGQKWSKVARELDRQVSNGCELVGDLRTKLF
jgi:hypothetical protein